MIIIFLPDAVKALLSDDTLLTVVTEPPLPPVADAPKPMACELTAKQMALKIEKMKVDILRMVINVCMRKVMLIC